LELRLNNTDDAQALSTFYIKNYDHLHLWEPKREGDFHSISSWRERLQERMKAYENGLSAHFISYDPDSASVIAVCELTNISRDTFQAAILGYSVATSHEGKGRSSAMLRGAA